MTESASKLPSQSLELSSSGLPWVDAEIGGFPRQGVIAVTGAVGSGKTTFGLSLATSALDRGARVCFLTNELPGAVLAAAERVYERDLRTHVEDKSLSILTFAPFFVKKMKSLQSVEKPLEELGKFIEERKLDVVIFDTFDSVLGWAEGADVKPVVAMVLARLRSWGIAVLCTLSDTVSAAAEFSHAADGSFELEPSRLLIRDAKWCNVADLDVPVQVIQGRGFIVGSSSQPPVDMAPPGELDELVATEIAPRSVSTIMPPSSRRAEERAATDTAVDGEDVIRQRASGPAESAPRASSPASPPRMLRLTPSSVASDGLPRTIPPPQFATARVAIPFTLRPPSFKPAPLGAPDDARADIVIPSALRAKPQPARPPQIPQQAGLAPTVPPPPDAAAATVPPPASRLAPTVPPLAPTVPPPAPTVPPSTQASSERPVLVKSRPVLGIASNASSSPRTEWIRRR